MTASVCMSHCCQLVRMVGTIFLQKSPPSRTRGLDMIQPPNQIQESCLYPTRMLVVQPSGPKEWVGSSSALVDVALFCPGLQAEASEYVRNSPVSCFPHVYGADSSTYLNFHIKLRHFYMLPSYVATTYSHRPLYMAMQPEPVGPARDPFFGWPKHGPTQWRAGPG